MWLPMRQSFALHPDELWLALALAVLPVIGVAALKVTHAFYFDRYFLEATAGYALLLAQATMVRGSRAFVARGMLVSWSPCSRPTR